MISEQVSDIVNFASRNGGGSSYCVINLYIFIPCTSSCQLMAPGGLLPFIFSLVFTESRTLPVYRLQIYTRKELKYGHKI